MVLTVQGLFLSGIWLYCQCETNCTEWLGLCTVKAPPLSGIWALFSMRNQLPRVAGWSTQYEHYGHVATGLCCQRVIDCTEWPDGLQTKEGLVYGMVCTM